jgi:hypothetical protein
MLRERANVVSDDEMQRMLTDLGPGGKSTTSLSTLLSPTGSPLILLLIFSLFSLFFLCTLANRFTLTSLRGIVSTPHIYIIL